MATVTPNFNWPVPTSTDLVKDGATAIEALGDSIDGAFVDLKGGTTGQVLAKASATDLDFAWVAQDDSNAIQNSIVDAKGDLIAASANDTPARLAVGNNGETLVADSSTSTGLRYQGSQVAAKNAIINGGMDIWQRGTSFGAGQYTADRWYQSGGTGTSAQETTVVPTGFRYAMKFTASGTTVPSFLSALETNDSLRFAGQTVCLSAYFASSTTRAVSLLLQYSTSVDNPMLSAFTTISATSGGTGTATSTYSRVSGVWSVPSDAKTIRIIANTGANMATSEIFYVTGIQLELGSVPTAFLRTGGTIQGELAACQRYYQQVFLSPTAGDVLCNSANFNTTSAYGTYQLKQTMRTSPTIVQVSGTNFYGLLVSNGVTTFNSFDGLGATSINTVRFDKTGLTLTQGAAGWFTANSTSASIALSSEL